MRRFLKLVLLSTLLLGGLSACNSQADTIISTQTQVLKQDPTNVSALIERGNAYRDKKDYTNALADHNQAITLEPGSYRAYTARGLDYIALSQFDNAVTDFTKSISLNPDQGEAYARRGEARVLLKSDYQLALNDFTKAQSLAFSDVRMLRYQGQAYFRTNQRDLAATTYLKAAEVNDANLRDSQIETLGEAISLGLNDYRIYLRRGTLERQKTSYDSAIDDFTEAIRLNSQSSVAFSERADAYYSIGACSSAESDLRAGCRLDNRRLCDSISLGCTSSSSSPNPLGSGGSSGSTGIFSPSPTPTPAQTSIPIGGLGSGGNN